jgi:pimeloyl-ACP methyl ester carboxylesterase
VHGDEDTAVPLPMALETHSRISDSHLMVLPYAAHAVNLEYPDVVAMRSGRSCPPWRSANESLIRCTLDRLEP